MPTLRIETSPHFLGAFSVGAGPSAAVLSAELGLSPEEAQRAIDRCVHGGEVVELLAGTLSAAESAAAQLNADPSIATVVATVLRDDPGP